MNIAILDTSEAQTNTVLIAGQAGVKMRVFQIYISADTAMTVTLKQGTSTVKWRQYVAANGGAIVGAVSGGQHIPILSLDIDTDLTITTSAAGNIFVSVGYY